MIDDNPQLEAPPGELFISYGWDNGHHVKAVLTLSNRLRSEGIDCVLDQYEQSPPEGWPSLDGPQDTVCPTRNQHLYRELLQASDG
jgi:SEFIR domain